MNKVSYPKQIQTFASQIGILKQRGMAFADETAAETWLHRVSYYRMSGYWYPLLADRMNHTFKPGTTFEQAVNLYEFDCRLREIVFRNIGRIEVAVRTQDLQQLFSEFPSVYAGALGFPPDWQQEPLWL